MKMETKTIHSFDQTTISYSVIGKGPALVMLHGNGGSSEYFYYQIHFFSQFYQVIAIDSRDHGLSENNADFLSFQQMSQDILEVLQAEKLEKVSILGFSDGANLALAFAANHPQSVEKLVLNAPNIYTTGVKSMSLFFSHIAYTVVHSLRFLSKHLRRFSRLFYLLIKDPDIPIEKLKKIDCPCLLVIGSKDVIKESHIREIAAILPHPEVQIIYGGKHTLSKQQPVLFNYIVLDFLNEKTKNQ